MKISSIFASATVAAVFSAGFARAQDGIEGLEFVGVPTPKGMGFQPAVTELARNIHWLDNLLLIIITVITLFVTALLIVVAVKFNRSKGNEPASFSHNTPLEIAWTLIPVLILIVIGSFSLPILFHQLEVPEADLTIKATGVQWAWEYEYPDQEVEFGAFMLGAGQATMNDEIREELAEYGYEEEHWKLATDEAMVVPVNAVVRMQVAAADVIHSWKIPAFGVQIDGVPGRLNETWFKAEKEGVYFGQCSELCGKDHSYMPIVVKVVSEEAFANWVEDYMGGTMANYEGVSDPTELATAD